MKIKKKKVSEKAPMSTKKKLIITVAMLLISAIIMATVSFAWMTLSRAPEVTGIDTSIGANGSLEIALLNSATKLNPSAVPTLVGGSLKNSVEGNYSWGNLVDLSDESFGLSNIKLLPARINASKIAGGYKLDNRSLRVPVYSYDGRIVDLGSNNVFTAVYKDGVFKTSEDGTDYGVRAIGTSSTVSAQASALTLAKSQIVVQTNNAKNSAINAMKNNDQVLLNIMLDYQTNGNAATFDDTDLNGLKYMIADLKDSSEYIDIALRQGVIAYAASKITDEDQFNIIENELSDTSNTIEEILAKYNITPPEVFGEWLDAYDNLDNSINSAKISADSLNGGRYTWAEISPIFRALIDIEGDVFINGKRIKSMSSDDLTALVGSNVEMTLAGGSGVFAEIANFTDDYNTFVNLIGETKVIVMRDSSLSFAYLLALTAVVSTLELPDGSNTNISAELTSTYGYIIDLAFRCNAPISDLILQSDPTQRVYEDSNSPSTMGGGSYMEFPLNDHFSLEQSIKLVDAVRIAFVDDQNNILGIAKLNTSNYTVVDNVLKAPIFLYDYYISTSGLTAGALIMGERKTDTNVITSLDQNVAKAVSTVVWLDGDIVDNTMVSAESEYSISGTLNLQFASSADLVPADNGDLKDMLPNKEELKTIIDENAAIYEAGQGMYTTISWNAFAKAYEYASSVYADGMSNELSISRAMKNLNNAANDLALTTADTLSSTIAEYRALMGTSNEIARYVVNENGEYKALDTYSVLQQDAKLYEIKAVDSNMNMHDEGNDFFTPVYTTETWEALADALYRAELVQWTFDNNLVDKNTVDIDNAISDLEISYKALSRKIFYEPYDYNGILYYRGLTNDSDTYGKWYTYDFKRVVADLRIIELDRYAEPIDLVTIELASYIENKNDVAGIVEDGRTDFLRLVSGYVSFNTSLYSVLRDETILYFTASDIGITTRAMTQSQKQALSAYIITLNAVTDENKIATRDSLIAQANALLDDSHVGRLSYTYAEASKVIYDIEVFLAPESDALREEKRVDLYAAMKLALENAKTIVQSPVYSTVYEEKVIDGKVIRVEKTIEITETHYQSLNDAIAAGNTLADSATIEEISVVFDALNDALVKHESEAVPYPTYSLTNSAHGDKPIYYAGDTLDLLIPYPATEENYRINIGDVFAVTTTGIIVHAEPKVITIYEKADGVDIVIPEKNAGGIYVGETTTLSAKLFYLDEDGVSKLATLPSTSEVIDEYTWASSDASCLVFDGNKVTAKKAGNVEITLSVKTREGNVYTAKANVSVIPVTD